MEFVWETWPDLSGGQVSGLVWRVRAMLAYWISPAIYPANKMNSTFVTKVQDGRGHCVVIMMDRRGKLRYTRCQNLSK